ncbi:MAG: extracellular solute-binding protein [Oscillospiraceae bacterium]|nr:extracellular solute-binding protein [Oscillospiraceae bacterium]
MRLRNLTALLLVAAFILVLFPSTQADRVDRLSAVELENLLAGITRDEDSYAAYRESDEVRAAAPATQDVTLYDDVLAFDYDEDTVQFTFTVQNAGLYNLAFEYLPQTMGNTNIIFGFLLNDELPFTEAGNLGLARMYRYLLDGEDRDENFVWDGTTFRDEFQIDMLGNHTNPGMIEIITVWQDYRAIDRESLFVEPFMIYLPAGEHTLTIISPSAPVYLRNIRMAAPRVIPTHAEYEAQHAGYQLFDGSALKYEAELAAWTNSIFIAPGIDLSSPNTTPYSARNMLLNVYGGMNWDLPNTSATWVVTAPQSGFFNLGMRYRQNFNHGAYSHRQLLINGEVPFAEAQSLNFRPGEGFRVFNFDYPIFLNEGENTITLNAVLGDSAPAVHLLREVLYDMNHLYRRIMVLTGPVPDPHRDYNLQHTVPGLIDGIYDEQTGRRTGAGLNHIRDNISTIIDLVSLDGTGAGVSQMRRAVENIDAMIAHPERITRRARLDIFRSGISELGLVLTNMQGQPLLLDSLMLSGTSGERLPGAAGFGAEVVHRFNRFLASFGMNQHHRDDPDARVVRVWMDAGVTGREQFQVLLEMIAQDFMPNNPGIVIQLDLVAGAVIEATLAGRGPEIALNQGSASPVNFGMRGALRDLSTFPGFEEMRGDFHPEAFVPFAYEDRIYGIPERMDFVMMFYRTDIFAEAGLQAPNTWEELTTTVLQRLRHQNMDVGVGHLGLLASPTTASVFTNLLFQNGGHIYSDDLMTTALDTQVAYEAFMTAVQFYTDFRMPREYDAFSRFRTGEMPMVINSYTFYNFLTMAAPEIAGLWRMVPIPGTPRDDIAPGFIDRSQPVTGMASVMFDHIRDPEAGWAFMQWWASAEVQAQFGLRQEALLGPGGRYTPANLNTFELLPWGPAELHQLHTQLAFVRAVPEVPGSYYVPRALNSAFTLSVVDGEDPRRMLLEWNGHINRELERRRNEFNFDPSGSPHYIAERDVIGTLEELGYPGGIHRIEPVRGFARG